MQHALELYALLITQAARPVGEQTLTVLFFVSQPTALKLYGSILSRNVW